MNKPVNYPNDRIDIELSCVCISAIPSIIRISPVSYFLFLRFMFTNLRYQMRNRFYIGALISDLVE